MIVGAELEALLRLSPVGTYASVPVRPAIDPQAEGAEEWILLVPPAGVDAYQQVRTFYPKVGRLPHQRLLACWDMANQELNDLDCNHPTYWGAPCEETDQGFWVGPKESGT